jgi:hypothetical protein
MEFTDYLLLKMNYEITIGITIGIIFYSVLLELIRRRRSRTVTSAASDSPNKAYVLGRKFGAYLRRKCASHV